MKNSPRRNHRFAPSRRISESGNQDCRKKNQSQDKERICQRTKKPVGEPAATYQSDDPQ